MFLVQAEDVFGVPGTLKCDEAVLLRLFVCPGGARRSRALVADDAASLPSRHSDRAQHPELTRPLED